MKVRCQGMPETHAAKVLGEKAPFDDERFTDTICGDCQRVLLAEIGVDKETIEQAVAECKASEARLRPARKSARESVREDVDGIPLRK